MSISLTFRTKIFLDESDELVSLDTLHHSFPLQHHLISELHNVFTLGEYSMF